MLEHIERLKGCMVVVEGKNDRKALESLGVSGIIELSKKPIYAIIEDVVESGKRCAILTDLDKKGKELYGKINSGLQRFGVRVDNSFREFLFRETKVRQIEGLYRYTPAQK